MIETNTLERGSIMDRNGKPLALQVNFYHLSANPTQIGDVERASEILAPLLDMPQSEIEPTLNRSLRDFVQMMLVITGPEWAKKVPVSLPFYNIGGDQDPVGEYGKGIYEVSNWLYDTGHHVKTKVYPGYRHEIHNYTAIKNEVEQGIISFMDSLIS